MKGLIILLIVSIFFIVIVTASINQSVQKHRDITNQPWPPHISKCPDYWEISKDDSTKCVNKSQVNRGKLSKNATLAAFEDTTPESRTLPKKIDNGVYWAGISD